ncbi:hypothetical protein J4416_02685 [Candidatus Pacearchaeota archaeon]|nr:hypothetical protein [Candidatus Pacearchaeota archaeon]
MANYETFYDGSEYPFEKKQYSGISSINSYHPSAKDIAYPSDPLSANQLKKVSDKISTGAQTIEVSGLGLMGGGPMKHLASIPKQHWKEIDRLRQLTGVDLTFHGPLVDPTGVTGRGNWSEDHRVEAERQMKAAVELAQQMNSSSAEENPKGMVMTFHSNNGLPEVKRRIITPDGKEQIVHYSVINERNGEIGAIPLIEDPFEGKGAPFKDEKQIKEWLETENKKQWANRLGEIAFENNRARREISEAFYTPEGRANVGEVKELQQRVLKMYDRYIKDPIAANKEISEDIKLYPDLTPEETRSVISHTINNLSDAEIFLNQAYHRFKDSFNEAHKKADGDSKNKLNKLRSHMIPVIEGYNKDKSKLLEFQKELTEGIQELKLIGAPNYYRPLEEFAVDKGSDTFANVALHAYQNAKAHHRAPGIISIENPPAGMSGLTRADEIVKLVKASREKFVERAVQQKIMSREKAVETSKQIIGATWDVGHINSIRKWGYNKEDVLGEAKTIAPFVKHMHIADNLGFEDSELPAGMGNVPIDEILNNKEWGENFRKAKKVIETGDWFSRQGGMGMSHTPVREAFSGLSAPVYSMGSASSAYWNDAINSDAGYFGGLGPINPEIHHSIYGGGFSNLPAYSGGELPGKASNSSFSGAPLD